MHKIDEDPLWDLPPRDDSDDGDACFGIVLGLISCFVFYGTLILTLRSC